MVTAGERDWDANWLQIEGSVRDGDLVWSFADPCMTTWEAFRLLEWLRRVARGEIEADGQSGGGVLSFTEPNVHFELHARSDTHATVVAYFSHESAPPEAEGEFRYGAGYEVHLTLTNDEFDQASDEWERELAAFPRR